MTVWVIHRWLDAIQAGDYVSYHLGLDAACREIVRHLEAEEGLPLLRGNVYSVCQARNALHR